MIKDIEPEIILEKIKIEHLIKEIIQEKEYNLYISRLIFDFQFFVNRSLHYGNLGMKNKLSDTGKVKYIEFVQEKWLQLSGYTEKANEKIKEIIPKNICSLYKYINKIDKEKNQNFYQCLSCIYGAFYGDCFKNFELSKYIKMTIFLSFAIMDNQNLKKLNPRYVDYYYLLWFLSSYNYGYPLGDFTYFVIYKNRLKAAIEEKFFDERLPNDEYDDFIFNGFLMRISPFFIWFYINNEKEIKDTLLTSSDKNFDKIINLFEKVADEINSIHNVNKLNNECIFVIAAFSILAFGAIIQLKSDKIINNLKILIKNYKRKFDSNDKFEIKKNKKWLKLKNLIVKELSYYEKNTNENNIKNYFTFSEQKSKIGNLHRYKISFRLTLYYLYHINNYLKENQEIDFDKIINEIYLLGGESRVNAAIVGTVIGPLVGYKNFSNKFEKIFKQIDNTKYYASPSLMVLFVYFLFISKKKKLIKLENSKIYFDYKEHNSKCYDRSFNTLRVIFNFLYNDIKLYEPDIVEFNEKINDISLEAIFDSSEIEEKIKIPNPTIKPFSIEKIKFNILQSEETNFKIDINCKKNKTDNTGNNKIKKFDFNENK